MIELRGIDKSFGETAALRAFDLSVPAGSTTVLLGPSGCGKSTVLHLANGLLTADRGEVRVAGELLHHGSVMRLRRRMGYVIQSGGLFPHLSARDNVLLMGRWLGQPRDDLAQRIGQLRDLVELPATALDRLPRELSGGQAQRVALMRALMLDPDVLLLDEPLGALDPMVRYELQLRLREIFRSLVKTVLLVTHDLAEAAFFADTVVLMRDGSAVQAGPPAEILAQPRGDFAAAFVRAQRFLPGEST